MDLTDLHAFLSWSARRLAKSTPWQAHVPVCSWPAYCCCSLFSVAAVSYYSIAVLPFSFSPTSLPLSCSVRVPVTGRRLFSLVWFDFVYPSIESTTLCVSIPSQQACSTPTPPRSTAHSSSSFRPRWPDALDMASAQSFSLFPNSVPKIAIPNPHKRTPSLHYPHSAATPRPDTMISPSGESIVIKIEQEPPVPSVPDQGHLQSWSRTPSPEDIGRAVTTSSPIDGRTPAPPLPPPPTRVRVPPPPLASSPQVSSSPEPGSIGSTSATLVQGPGGGTSTKSYGLKSPVVPIRSMFPTYDPSLPLHRQNYYPQRPLPARLSGIPISREEYRGSLSTPFDRAMGQMSAPPSVLNFPVDALSISGPRYSSARELDKLWEASHGAEPNDAIKMFDLEMARCAAPLNETES